MKTIKTLLLLATLTFSSVLIASTKAEEKGTELSVITDEIGKLLENPNFTLEKDALASVTLTLNKNNEMVVLSVDTNENYLAHFIKSRLNYNELPTSFKTYEKTFVVPVRITPEE